MFSESANQFQEGTNPLYRERNARAARGEPIIDLISGNVNAQGIFYPPAPLERALAAALKQARSYRPDPLGQKVAREAISAYYSAEGSPVSPDRLILTPGTSISYWYAFQLLANPGEEILCPQPTYPLFDSIAALSGVRLVYYPIRASTASNRWEIDFDRLEAAITSNTRAMILISPHNPTGAVASEAEVEALTKIAIDHHLPIISDEVFAPFLFTRSPLPRPAERGAPLVLTLNGLSKMFALPGMKIGWIALSGDAASVNKAKVGLETISDTFLPVNEIAQFALPALFEEGEAFLTDYRSEILNRVAVAMELLSKAAPLSFIPPEGGFYLTIRVNRPLDEETIALDLLRRHGILVHPGFFYDLPPAHFVLSFVSTPAVLRDALGKIVGYFSSQ